MSDATAVRESDLGGEQGTKGFQDEPMLNLPDEAGVCLLTRHKSTDPLGLNKLISKSKGRRQGCNRLAGVNTSIHLASFSVDTYTDPPHQI